MKLAAGAGVLIVVAGVAGLFFLPLLVVAGVAGLARQSAASGAGWDVPPEVLPSLQSAAASSAVPWSLLAAIASVATDFGRHAPDGLERGGVPGTAIYPVVTPAIRTAGGGAGMFLLDDRLGPPDAQDVASAAGWLASRLAALANGGGLTNGALTDPAVAAFWQRLLSEAPVVIAAPASVGDNSIRQFAAAVMTGIGAPASAANLDAFAAWAAGEGTCARYNPLATTQPEPGALPFNDLSGGGHVWNYPSFGVGVRATTTALTNGLYQPVLDAFRSSAGVGAVAGAVVRSPWGTKHFGSPSYAGRPCPGGFWSGSPTPLGTDSLGATIVARAAVYEQEWAALKALGTAP